jgi:hypothetical protein
MLPCAALFYEADMVGGDAKVFGNFGVMPEIGMNILDLLFGKARGAIRGANGSRAVQVFVPMVAGNGVPSKIGYDVVCSVAVVVAGVISGWSRAYKRAQNKIMNAATVVSAKHDSWVSVFANAMRQQRARYMPFGHSATRSDYSWKRANATKIAYFVSAFKAGNWHPDFIHSRIVSGLGCDARTMIQAEFA